MTAELRSYSAAAVHRVGCSLLAAAGNASSSASTSCSSSMPSSVIRVICGARKVDIVPMSNIIDELISSLSRRAITATRWRDAATCPVRTWRGRWVDRSRAEIDAWNRQALMSWSAFDLPPNGAENGTRGGEYR